MCSQFQESETRRKQGKYDLTLTSSRLKLRNMPEGFEKRGPIEKSPKGWPINPLGVVALLIFALLVVFLIVRPLVYRINLPIPGEMANSSGGRIIMPQAGEIVRGDKLTIELVIDNPKDVEKVQFWLKTYADGKWQMIGEKTSVSFKLDWQISDSYRNKAIAITTHIYKKDGNIIKDPGGWREGIIILSP